MGPVWFLVFDDICNFWGETKKGKKSHPQPRPVFCATPNRSLRKREGRGGCEVSWTWDDGHDTFFVFLPLILRSNKKKKSVVHHQASRLHPSYAINKYERTKKPACCCRHQSGLCLDYGVRCTYIQSACPVISPGPPAKCVCSCLRIR